MLRSKQCTVVFNYSVGHNESYTFEGAKLTETKQDPAKSRMTPVEVQMPM